MIKDAQIRGSFGFCLRRHGGRILAGKLDLRIVEHDAYTNSSSK